MTDFSQIFKATYSGVPVYEMQCKGVAVMRRRSDSYLNATQILKVAGFDKPQRTRILEREVQTGQHEKVQGGYGKYQGTWVPFERGNALATLYEVDRDLAPILEFIKGDESPPLAPKHVTAASVRPKKARETRTRKRVKHFDDDSSDVEQQSTPRLGEARIKEEASSAITSGSPLPAKRTRIAKKEKSAISKPQHASTPKKARNSAPLVHEDDDMDELDDNDDMDDASLLSEESSSQAAEYDLSGKPYAQKFLQYFMSNKTGIPPLLLHPPRNLDVNVIIDDEGHTSLHWASALARIKIVKLILENGADTGRVNYKGQTALMRSVLFTNNFDEKTFDQLLTLLRTTIFNIDKKDQTVFHHIASTAAWKGKMQASRYYMECLISKLASNQSELISILNVQDANGDTALTIAARIDNKRLVKLLIEAGASTEIANEEGMTSRDYMTDLESRGHSPPDEDSQLITEAYTRDLMRSRIEAMFKNVVDANPASAPPPISEMFDSLPESYERDLLMREREVQKKKIELDLQDQRLKETERVLKLATEKLGDSVSIMMGQLENQGEAMEKQLKNWTEFSQKEKLSLYVDQLEQNEKEEKPSTLNSLHELEEQAHILTEQLNSLQALRKKNISRWVELTCRLPPKKYQDYKRLISTCCNVDYENVDMMLAPLLESFNEDADTQGA